MTARRLTALFAGCFLVFAACGSDDDSSADDATTSTSVGGNGSGDADATRAEGEPVRVGYINLESPTIDQSAIRLGSEAAAEYVNEELGGIAGRPIELVVCKTLATPESAGACANEMISEGVVAVMVGSEAFRAQIVPRLTEAGIPWITISASDESEHELSPVFVMSSGITGIHQSVAQYASEQGWTDFVIFNTDVPSAVAVIESSSEPAFEEAGVDLHVVPIPSDLADATPFVSDALRNDPQGYLIVGSTPQCVAVMQAMMAAAPEVQQMAISQCTGSEVFEALGEDALNDTLLVHFVYGGTDTEEGALYHENIAEYGESALDPGGIAEQGWSTVVTFVRALNESGITADDITPESVVAAMQASEEVPLALGAGETMTCDGEQLDGFPNACSNSAFLIEIDGPSGRELLDTIEL